MADLLQVLGTVFEFFAFALLATAAVCVPMAITLWSYELVDRVKLNQRRTRHRNVIPLAKIA
jgi:hypothetical protein